MGSWATIRTRYLQDGVDVRLGGLAANLLRIRSYADRPDHGEVVSRLVRESALFIEWMASDADACHQSDLATLQRELLQWHRVGNQCGVAARAGRRWHSRPGSGRSVCSRCRGCWGAMPNWRLQLTPRAAPPVVACELG